MLKKLHLSLFVLFMALAAYAQNSLPEFSSEESPLWYYVQFKTGGNVLSDKGSGKNLQTATKAKTDANQWQFIGTAEEMYMKSKNGNYIYYNGSKFAASTSSKTSLKIVKSSNGAGGWEIQRKSANGQSMNQWGGTAVGAELGEWSAGDNNNPVTFLPSSPIVPIFSLLENEQWYYIQFAISDQSFKDCGEGNTVAFTSLDVCDEQLWKFVGNIDSFQIVSKAGLYACVSGSNKSDGRLQTKATPDAHGFSFAESSNSEYSSNFEIVPRNPSFTSTGLNRLGGGGWSTSEVGFWDRGDKNNPLKFTKQQDVKSPDFKVIGAESFAPENTLTLWYNKPATLTDAANKWMEYSLPIGNGQLGACLYGGIAADEIQFNEKTLWEGGPNDMGGYGGYKNFGSVFVEDLSGDIGYSTAAAAKEYVRYLDIETGTAGVRYTNADGSTKYERKYISSQPDGVIAARYTASGSGKLHLKFSVAPGTGINASAVTYSGNTATFGGKLTTVTYNAYFRVVPVGEGATVSTDKEGITVSNADAVTLIFSGGTDYDSSTASCVSGTSKLASKIKGYVDAAALKEWETLYSTHVENFKSYMGRVNFRLGGASSTLPTNELIDNYNTASKNITGKEAEVLFLEQLYFAYGRYLLISSSRGINVPNNLQGIWNNLANAPWNSDIHTNINIQMNYWPAEPTNLSDTHLPFLDYIITMAQRDNWKKAAKRGGQTKGWTVFTESNIFGGMSTWGSNYFVANVWYCSHLWQHYRYTLDKEFLARAFPVMWSCAEFWFERMIKDRKVGDGTWVCPDEYSPEQNDNPKEDATAHAQQLVYTHLVYLKKAIDILGQEKCRLTDQQMATLDEYLANTDQGLHTEQFKGGTWADWGTKNGVSKGAKLLREWKYSSYTVSGDKAHRHMSHLMCLHPLDQISPSSEYFKPAVNALKLRGDEATGWSMGWKVNLWARALDGNHAHRIIKNALKHSTSYSTDQYKGGIYYNLFDSHAPFQIDGNFGVCAGVAELLMQSHTDTIHIHPALPSVWADGSISGLKAVGDFTVGIEWSECKATKATIKNNKGEACFVKYDGVNKALVKVNGEEIDVIRLTKNVCRIPSAAGDEIEIDFTQTATGIKETAESITDGGYIYDINGRRVAAATKGIYIKNGKKIFVR